MLTTVVEFKDYIFKKLGSEIHDIDVTDAQWNFILDDGYKEFTEYSNDGSLEAVVKLTPTSNIIKCSDNVLNIKEILDGIDRNTSGVSTMFVNTNLAIPISMVDYYTLGSGSTDMLESILSTKKTIQHINDVYKSELDFDFNSETKRLVIHTEDVPSEIIIICDVAEPIELVLNHKYLKLNILSKVLYQWATNLSIKYNTEEAPIIGNGLKLNPTQMREDALKYEEEWKLGVEENELDSYLLPRSLYDIN